MASENNITAYADFKPHHSFSQDGEDMILRSLLSEAIPDFDRYKGFYIDIGAHHPLRFSNTAYFYEQGWHGINIEPTPGAIKLFEQYREKDINLNIGIGLHQEKRTLYCFNESALNTFDKEFAESRDPNDSRYHIIETTEVEIFPLAQILDKHLPAGNKIDFMSIDVAGLDIELLESNDWDKYRPQYLLVEDVDNITGKMDASEVYQFFRERGYEQLGYKTLRTLIFKAS